MRSIEMSNTIELNKNLKIIGLFFRLFILFKFVQLPRFE